MRNLGYAGWFLVATAVLLPTWAPAEKGQDSVQWYAVEVVLFDQRGAGSEDGERWSRDPSLPTVEQRLVSVGSIGESPGFSALADEARKLNGIRRELAGTSGYQVLAHIAWRQPGLAKDLAPAVALPAGWDPPTAARLRDEAAEQAADSKPLGADSLALSDERLSAYAKRASNPFAQVPDRTQLFGTIRAYRERYLHLEMDLRFAPDGWPRGNTEKAEPSSKTGDLTAAPHSYAFRQERRLRSDEIHYLDHPALGMVTIIRPIDRPEGAAALPAGQ